MFSSSSKKNTEQHIRPLSKVIHSRTTHMTTYLRIIATANKQRRAHVTDPNNAQPPRRHGVIKRTVGGSLARSWPPPLRRRSRCCVLLLLLLSLSAAAAANNRYAVVASVACRLLRLSFSLCEYASCARVRQRAATQARSHQTQTDDRRLAHSLLAAPAAARPLRAAAATAVGPDCCYHYSLCCSCFCCEC